MKKRMRFWAAGLAAAALALQTAAGETAVPVLAGDLEVSAAATVVMEADSGRVLFAQNPDTVLPNASTTKMMTALIALEQPDLDEPFTVDGEAIRVEGTTMGLQPGDTVTLRQLAAGMLLPSGNDAAVAAAVRIAGSEAAFVREMNRRAEAMGLTGTHYANPHGLDAPGHGSTARDLARLAAAALENENFRALCGLEELRLAYGNPPYNRTLYTTNALLERCPEAIGVKTGYTDGAGFCLVSAAERDGTTLIIATLDGEDVIDTHIRLYEHFFPLLARVDLSGYTDGLTVPVVGGAEGEVSLLPAAEPRAALLEREYPELVREVEAPRFLYAPVEEGEAVGRLRLLSGGQTVYETALVAGEAVEAVRQEGGGPLGFLQGIFSWNRTLRR